jgi:nucleotide-binding universal stress UspA family protein
MFTSILAATDLSEASDPVVRAAASLAKLAEADLHLLHVIEIAALPYASASEDLARIDRSRDAALDAIDEQVERAVPGADTIATREVAIGPVHTALLERAREVGADLVVMGPHRLRPFGDRFLGSTADRVVRSAPMPCLLVRGPVRLPLRTVMHPTDLSERSASAMDVALRWTAALGAGDDGIGPAANLLVVHVVPRMYEMPDFAFDDEVILPEVQRAIREATERVPTAAEISERITWGDLPADEILQAAEREKVDLLVLATHGHGAVRRALLGSVASTVARAAPCPVLLVPPIPGDASHE